MLQHICYNSIHNEYIVLPNEIRYYCESYIIHVYVCFEGTLEPYMVISENFI